MSFVVDNSVALTWCFEDEQNDAVLALLRRVTTEGAHAPQIWPMEAVNVLLMAERRQRIDRARRLRLSSFLASLPIAIDGETAERMWQITARLAEDHDLSAYDATYLELSIRLGLPLATGDRQLAAAAVRAGVPVLPAA